MKLRKITQNSELSTYEWEQLIDKWIFSERDRYIMKRALLDEASYETISEEVGLSVRHTKTIASTSLKKILANINSSLK